MDIGCDSRVAVTFGARGSKHLSLRPLTDIRLGQRRRVPDAHAVFAIGYEGVPPASHPEATAPGVARRARDLPTEQTGALCDT